MQSNQEINAPIIQPKNPPNKKISMFYFLLSNTAKRIIGNACSFFRFIPLVTSKFFFVKWVFIDYNLTMIQAYLKSTHLKPISITAQNLDLLSKDDAIWIDVCSPTKDEERMLEKELQLEIPTREEMLEIEVSSRLYVENDNIFMTANLLAKSESPEPKTDAITLICTEDKFISIRYIEANAINLFASRLTKIKPIHYQNSFLLIEFLDATIDC